MARRSAIQEIALFQHVAVPLTLTCSVLVRALGHKLRWWRMADISTPFQHRAVSAGVTEHIIREVIEDFYGRVQKDALLGPVFDEAIGNRWEPHLDKIHQFWLTATRLGGRYEGRDFMPAHLKLSGIGSKQMEQWLLLFRRTVDERCTPEAADALFDIAARMGESILFALNRTDKLP